MQGSETGAKLQGIHIQYCLLNCPFTRTLYSILLFQIHLLCVHRLFMLLLSNKLPIESCLVLAYVDYMSFMTELLVHACSHDELYTIMLVYIYCVM